MAQPADVRRVAEQLIGVYRAAWAEVTAELARINEDPARFRRSARLRETQARVEALMAHADAQAHDWLQRTYPSVYGAGAESAAASLGSSFSWSAPHLDAVTALAQDTFRDLLAATDHVSRTTRRLIRQLTQSRVLSSVTTGRPAQQAAVELRRLLEDEGVSAVVYSDGSRHGLAEYAEVVVLTKTAVAYNAGTLNHSVGLGTRYFECFDGPACGLRSHDDRPLASGMVASAQTVADFPISHPRCVRSWGPRPDITTDEEAAAAGASTTPAQQADQVSFSQRRDNALRRVQRRQQRDALRASRP
jgi:hypothetical protein